MLLLTKVFISGRGDKEGRVFGPFLNTGEVEERETAGAAPHLQTEGQRLALTLSLSFYTDLKGVKILQVSVRRS